MEKKVTKKKPGKKDALQHIERIKAYGPPYYKKSDVIKILRSFISMYWR